MKISEPLKYVLVASVILLLGGTYLAVTHPRWKNSTEDYQPQRTFTTDTLYALTESDSLAAQKYLQYSDSQTFVWQTDSGFCIQQGATKRLLPLTERGTTFVGITTDKTAFFHLQKELIAVRADGTKQGKTFPNVLYWQLLNDSTFLCLQLTEKDSLKAEFALRNREGQPIAYLATVDGFEPRYTSKPEAILTHVLQISRTDHHIVFAFLHLPYLYVFDTAGRLLQKIQTLDNVPPPHFTRYNNMYLYERERTFNSNLCAFVKDNQVNVFSYRSPLVAGQFTLDHYDLRTGDYLHSSVWKHEGGTTNIHIENVFFHRQHLLVKTEEGIVGFPR